MGGGSGEVEMELGVLLQHTSRGERAENSREHFHDAYGPQQP